MRPRALALVCIAAAFVVLGGCSGEAAPQAPIPDHQTASTTVTTAPAARVTTTSAATSPAPATTTTTMTTTTTTTTTSTTLAPLDRSDEATLSRMQEDMAALLVNGPRLAGSASEAAAAGHMESRLEDAGLEVLTHPVPLPNGSDSRNLITTVGDGPRHVLVGAHYDSIEGSPGADDNGSGTVVLLELARRLAEAPPRGLQVTLAWFGAEEVLPGYSSNDHHYGSRQMAARMEDAGTLPDEMLSVDMVGYDDAILAATYRDLDPAAAERLIEAGTAVGAVVTLSSRGDISDHEAFARAGVPAVMMWRPWNPGYHSAGDDTVNWNKILEDLAIVEAWLALQPS